MIINLIEGNGSQKEHSMTWYSSQAKFGERDILFLLMYISVEIKIHYVVCIVTRKGENIFNDEGWLSLLAVTRYFLKGWIMSLFISFWAKNLAKTFHFTAYYQVGVKSEFPLKIPDSHCPLSFLQCACLHMTHFCELRPFM